MQQQYEHSQGRQPFGRDRPVDRLQFSQDRTIGSRWEESPDQSRIGSQRFRSRSRSPRSSTPRTHFGREDPRWSLDRTYPSERGRSRSRSHSRGRQPHDRAPFGSDRPPSPSTSLGFAGISRGLAQSRSSQYLFGSSRRSRFERTPSSNRSPSPPYGRSASPRRSTSPCAPPCEKTLPRSILLAKRILTVDGFRDEIYKLSNGVIREDDLKLVGEPIVRVPVLLWSGETLAQYEQQFDRWLDSRRMSLGTLREDPPQERSMWQAFAHTRAGTSIIHGQKPVNYARKPSPRRRSRSRSHSRSSSRSSQRNLGRKRSFSPANAQPPASVPSSLAPPENAHILQQFPRWILLERRVVSLTDFQKFVDQGSPIRASMDASDLPKIPVPLCPGESMGLYDHKFWTWLKDFDETKDSLRSDPVKERGFRRAFAYLRSSSKKSRLANAAAHPTPTTRVGILQPQQQREVAGFSVKRKMSEESDNVDRQTPCQEVDSKRPRFEAGNTVQAHVTPDQSPSTPTDKTDGASSKPQNFSSQQPARLPEPTNNADAPPAQQVEESETAIARAIVLAPTTTELALKPAPSSTQLAVTQSSKAQHEGGTPNAVEKEKLSAFVPTIAPKPLPAKAATRTLPGPRSPTGAQGQEVHDGDVMNAEGCCCVKCMRSWARALSDRMAGLEQNVMDLKRDIIDHASC